MGGIPNENQIQGISADRKVYSCDLCNYTSSYELAFERHYERSLRHPHRCEKCFYHACTPQDLQSHQTECHSSESSDSEHKTVQTPLKLTPAPSTSSPNIEWKVRKRSKPLQIFAKEIPESNIIKAIESAGDDLYYSCIHCDFWSNDSEKFSDHILLRRPGSPLQCMECSFKSCVSSDMRQHAEHMHLTGTPSTNSEALPLPLQEQETLVLEDYPSAPKEMIKKSSDSVPQLIKTEIPIVKTNSPTPVPSKCGEEAEEAQGMEVDEEIQDGGQISEDSDIDPMQEVDSIGPPVSPNSSSSNALEDTIIPSPSVEERKLGREVEIRLFRIDVPTTPKKSPTESQQICPFCKKDFSHAKYYLENHMRTHTGEKPFQCSRCSFSTAHPIRLTSHKRSGESEGGILHKCLECDFSSCTRHSFSIHLKAAHGVTTPTEQKHLHQSPRPLVVKPTERREPKGEECEQIVQTTKKRSVGGLRGQADENLFKCNRCCYATKQRNHLNDHRKSRGSRQGQLYQCFKCPFNSCTWLYLKMHLKESHLLQKKVVSRPRPAKPSSLQPLVHDTTTSTNCTTQDRQTGNMKEVQMKTCPYCKKGFRTYRYLEEHVRIHTGDKPHKCKFCSFTSAQRAAIYSHNKTRGSKVHSCPQCSYTSCNTFCMKKHIRETHPDPVASLDAQHLHAEPQSLDQSSSFQNRMVHKIQPRKPNKCRFCHYQAFSSSRVRVHERVHTGEKPFTCKTCGKTFSQISSMYKHRKLHLEPNSVRSLQNDVQPGSNP